MSSDQTVTATFASGPPTAGGYSGSNGQNGNGLSFYVSADGTQIQDVLDSAVGLTCTGGGGATDHLGIDEVPVAPDGSFTSTTTQTGIFGGTAATFTYTFKGHSAGASFTGTYREDITYNDGTSSCTSNNQSWSATRGTQPSQIPSSPPAGSYSGSNGQNGNGLSFYVSADGTQIQDVLDSAVGLTCTGGGGATDHLGIDEVPVAPDGSFTSTTTQTGIFGGTAATFTYTFKGHVHGTNSAGAERVAGTYREDITYKNGAATCTSNNQAWSATRGTQPSQIPSPPPAGSYSGSNGQNGNGLSFYVSADGTQIQDVLDSAVGLTCTGGGGATDHLGIDEVTVAPDGSFTSTTTQTGIFGGTAATFTYTFKGHVHGTNSAGAERVAGTYREDITYNNGAATCTSNNQAWSATH